jgi:hypothetical protein
LKCPLPKRKGFIVVLQKRPYLLRHPLCGLVIIPTGMSTKVILCR